MYSKSILVCFNHVKAITMLTINKAKGTILAMIAALAILTGCNKEFPEAVSIVPPPNGTGPTIATILNDPSFSILKAAVTKANLMTSFADSSLRFTLIAPDDAAFIASGLPLIAITNVLTVEQVTGLVSYMTLPQVLGSANFPTTFPNLQYASILNPAPSASAFLRLTAFPSKRGSVAWVNNIPIIAADMVAANGVVLKVARVVAPPTQFLWDRISTDTNLTYLRAAIIRADSLETATGAITLQNYLGDAAGKTSGIAFGPNFTLFAPSDLAFKQILTGLITQALIAQGMPPATALATATFLASTPAVFSNPALYGALSAQTVKGILVYHILGSRAFSVNLPTTADSVKTLLNGAIPSHPGVTLQATFGPAGVTAATVKGKGNAAASNIAINPTPAPVGTSDQHYINGVLHVIDQVLRPQ